MMEPEERIPLQRVLDMQGFDGTVPASRDVYMILDWTRGKVRRKYNMSLIFDGAQRGLGKILLEHGSSALCVGRDRVRVGIDDPVVTTFARKFDTGKQDAWKFIQAVPHSLRLGPPIHATPQTFGPFSADQQQYAAGLIDADISTLYGFRARWVTEGEIVEERYYSLQAHSPTEAIGLLQHYFRQAQPYVDPTKVIVEVDDTRLEFIVSDFSLFSTGRISHLNEDAFIEAFHLGPVLE